jgi:outer membrane protein assembly factor BamB
MAYSIRGCFMKNSVFVILLLSLLVQSCSAIGSEPGCQQTKHDVVSNNNFRLLWSKTNIDALHSMFNPMIQGASSKFFVGVQASDYDAAVLAFDIKTGDLLWRQTLKLPANILATDTNLYVGSYNRLVVHDPETGHKKKEIELPKVGTIQNIYSSGHNLYIRSGNGSWVTYNTNNDAVKISESLLPYAPFIVEHETLYLHDVEGFKALEMSSQSIIWNYSIQEVINPHPIFTNDMVIISTQTGKVYALNKDNGELIWSQDFQILGNLATDTSRLFFLTETGYLKVIDLKSGQELQELAFSPGAFQVSTSDKIVGGYNVWADAQTEIVIVSLGDSCQLMAIKLETP